MLTRRDFFGAAAGTLAAGTRVKGTDKKQEFVKVDTGYWAKEWFLCSRPELELGHSARYVIQRYKGAKWTAIHRVHQAERSSPSPIDEGYSDARFCTVIWHPIESRDFRFKEIYPVITDCLERENV